MSDDNGRTNVILVVRFVVADDYPIFHVYNNNDIRRAIIHR